VRARSLLAVVPQRSNLDRSISIRRNLTFHAAYHGVPAAEASHRADELLEQFGLSERGDVKPDLFSGGQAQRMMIARALMHEPQVLFLDEPTTGLDPAARLFVWDRLRDLRDRGVTLILTTHDMHEAATLADRVGIMDHGKVLALDTPEALMRGLPGSSTLELSVRAVRNGDGPGALVQALELLGGVEQVESLPGDTADGESAGWRVRLYVTGEASELIAPTATLLADRGLALSGVELGAPSLEDVFIHLTGRALR
jgi:ABC-2 type transport system ATP-binding protein